MDKRTWKRICSTSGYPKYFPTHSLGSSLNCPASFLFPIKNLMPFAAYRLYTRQTKRRSSDLYEGRTYPPDCCSNRKRIADLHYPQQHQSFGFIPGTISRNNRKTLIDKINMTSFKTIRKSL